MILQASRGARSYAGDVMLRRMVEAAAELHPAIPVCLHQDHGDARRPAFPRIQHGFTSVMMDGSLEEDGKTPADYDYNVAVTASVAEMAHAVGVSVEGELGCLGSLESGQGEAEDGHGAEGALSRDQLLTDPDQARDFVARTGVDALAVAIGTSHGAYKFTREPDRRHPRHGRRRGDPRAAAEHASRDARLLLRAAGAAGHLQRATAARCRRPGACPSRRSSRGIRHGVRKVNIDTDCRIAMAGQFRKVATEKRGEFDPRAFLKPAMAALTALCAQRFEEFGTAGQRPKLKSDRRCPRWRSATPAARSTR